MRDFKVKISICKKKPGFKYYYCFANALFNAYLVMYMSFFDFLKPKKKATVVVKNKEGRTAEKRSCSFICFV